MNTQPSVPAIKGTCGNAYQFQTVEYLVSKRDIPRYYFKIWSFNIHDVTDEIDLILYEPVSISIIMNT